MIVVVKTNASWNCRKMYDIDLSYLLDLIQMTMKKIKQLYLHVVVKTKKDYALLKKQKKLNGLKDYMY